VPHGGDVLVAGTRHQTGHVGVSFRRRKRGGGNGGTENAGLKLTGSKLLDLRLAFAVLHV